MNEKRAEMFNKKAAKPKYKADQIIEKLDLKPGQIIADIGSGGGYFTYRFANIVGENGKVYAVDTNEELLEFIKKQVKEKGLTNVITVLTKSEHPSLPKHTFDYIFMRNMTHHLSNRVDYFKRLKDVLKTDGKVIIIEYDGRGGFFSFQRLHRHFVPKQTLIDEMKQAGYKIHKSFDFLSEQSFTIFSINT
ncbi:MAG: class I SAM-dependent methyltransferase [Thermoplasmatota archaeon]